MKDFSFLVLNSGYLWVVMITFDSPVKEYLAYKPRKNLYLRWLVWLYNNQVSNSAVLCHPINDWSDIEPTFLIKIILPSIGHMQTKTFLQLLKKLHN